VGAAKAQGSDVLLEKANALAGLYAYGEEDVLFKPTKAVPSNHFRNTTCGALSYFIGPKLNATCRIPTDEGFALQPWSCVSFQNAGCIIRKGNSPTALCMGMYIFVDALSSKKVPVDYSFGYVKKNKRKGNLLITLHHSSLPFTL
jgi:hypothetical protein